MRCKVILGGKSGAARSVDRGLRLRRQPGLSKQLRTARDLEVPIDALIAILEIALIDRKGGGGGNDEPVAQGNSEQTASYHIAPPTPATFSPTHDNATGVGSQQRLGKNTPVTCGKICGLKCALVPE
jgi:hypothetical protein